MTLSKKLKKKCSNKSEILLVSSYSQVIYVSYITHVFVCSLQQITSFILPTLRIWYQRHCNCLLILHLLRVYRALISAFYWANISTRRLSSTCATNYHPFDSLALKLHSMIGIFFYLVVVICNVESICFPHLEIV